MCENHIIANNDYMLYSIYMLYIYIHVYICMLCIHVHIHVIFTSLLSHDLISLISTLTSQCTYQSVHLLDSSPAGLYSFWPVHLLAGTPAGQNSGGIMYCDGTIHCDGTR